MPHLQTHTQYLFVPFVPNGIERKEDGCYVEGYAFVNEVVPGEGGIRLKRSAMEAATDEYMAFGNIREMHDRKAAGVALSATWDKKGVRLRAKIVDPVAALKVEERVYKGFSVGVNPLILRDKDVEKLAWVETSLVDRPKDLDAVFFQRAEDSAVIAERPGFDPQAVVEAVLLSQPEPEPEPDEIRGGEKSESVETETAPNTDAANAGGEIVISRVIKQEDGKWCVYSEAGKKLGSFETKEQAEARLREIEYFKDQDDDADNRAASAESVPVRENLAPAVCPNCGKACEYCADAEKMRVVVPPEIPTNLTDDSTNPEAGKSDSLPADPASGPDVERLTEQVRASETRFAEATAEIERLTKALTASEERAEKLASEPVPITPPLRFPAALTREHYMNQGQTANDTRQALEKEKTELSRMAPAIGDMDEQRRRVKRLYDIDQLLQALGGP